MKPLEPQDVVDLHTHLCEQVGATLVDAESKEAIEALRAKLIALGLDGLKVYQGSYATTLGKTIYLPYTPGVPNQFWSLVDQCQGIAHETHHVEFFNENPTIYTENYLLRTEDRAFYESQCYRGSSEVLYFLTGQPMNPSFLDCLHAYFCTESDIAFAKQILSDSLPTTLAGGVYIPTAKMAIKFLRERGYTQ